MRGATHFARLMRCFPVVENMLLPSHFIIRECLGGRCGSFFFKGTILLKHTPHFLKPKNTCFLVGGVVVF